MGHVRGDPVCTAGSSAVWKGVPEGFKKRIEARAKGNTQPRKGGKGKGGSTQRNAGKRKADGDLSKLPCHNWSRGNGFCKYADACRYSHSGPKGGGANKTSLATTEKQPKKKKVKLTAMAVTSSNGSKRREMEGVSDDSDHLYELIRGVPSVIVANNRSIKFDDRSICQISC